MVMKRDAVLCALRHEPPPWVPWSIGLTGEAREHLERHTGRPAAELLDDHILWHWVGGHDQLGDGRVRDRWGVVWNRSVDKDIGVIEGRVLPEPDLSALRLPEPDAPWIYDGIATKLARHPDRFHVFAIGFSLYERAWTLRGMEELMTDMVERPEFVDALLDRICDWNVAVVQRALAHGFDAVYFGDDWGAQRGLQMGPKRWRRFILPRLRRMYGAVRAAGRYQFIHSCGDVDEVFDDLIDAGLSCFNPFQPEVMDVDALFAAYRGRLAFHGGLSTQRTLPYGTPADVAAETDRLLAHGRQGGYLFAPAHAVEGDVPAQNLLAAVERLRAQPGYRALSA